MTLLLTSLRLRGLASLFFSAIVCWLLGYVTFLPLQARPPAVPYAALLMTKTAAGEVKQQPAVAEVSSSSSSSMPGAIVQLPPVADFKASFAWQKARQNGSLYYFDRPGSLLPLMRLLQTPAYDETDRDYRIRVAREWAAGQSLVVAATARSAMPGLATSLANLARLRRLFRRSWLLVVENNSQDQTRQFLLRRARQDPGLMVLGCGAVNSRRLCRIDMRYASGQKHEPGLGGQSVSDEIDRGLVMSALRNEYLNFAYNHLADKADLLLVIDPDVVWQGWDLDSILQGLYYFKTRPRLQQLCANTLDVPVGAVFDPCTLTFFNNKHFGEDSLHPAVSYDRSILHGPKKLPPVKVDSCFQAFAFYRLSHLKSQRLQYERSHGEWMCEHNTLSRQLQEVYLDPQMRLNVAAANIG